MNYKDNPRFIHAFNKMIQFEGGFNENPNDPGGATNFGISLRFLQSIEPTATRETIINLKKDEAAELYYKYFWLANGYDDLVLGISTPLFNFCVNMGARSAHKLLQRALNAAAGEEVLTVDGVIGEKTKKEMEKYAGDSHAVASALREAAAGKYRLLAQKPELSVFLKGWLRRAYSA